MTDDEMINFIAGYTQRHGYPPVHREIAEYFGLTYPSIQYRLRQLQAEGRLTWKPNRPRTIQILQEAS
jgi:SOS-response transcriptional repressor LexA